MQILPRLIYKMVEENNIDEEANLVSEDIKNEAISKQDSEGTEESDNDSVADVNGSSNRKGVVNGNGNGEMEHLEKTTINLKDLDEERIVNSQISQEMKKAYIDYAMSVIVSRALPSVEDGLKPVHRRILYAMKQMGLEKGMTKKSARIVGDTMGKFHPHGDMAIYDSMVRMAQDFSLRYPLVHGQGNFGSMDGDSAAASRYTEAKLNKIAVELLQDLEKDWWEISLLTSQKTILTWTTS